MPRKIRQIRVEGNIAYVPLTRGYEAIIDAADVLAVSGENWQARPSRGTVYAMSSKYHPGGVWSATIMHRVIIAAPPGLLVDHINGDGLDNRRSNLRLATVSQNAHNSRHRANNTSGHKGVWWSKARRRWCATIYLNRRKIDIGRFLTVEEAAAAYAAKSALLHGDFGRV